MSISVFSESLSAQINFKTTKWSSKTKSEFFLEKEIGSKPPCLFGMFPSQLTNPSSSASSRGQVAGAWVALPPSPIPFMKTSPPPSTGEGTIPLAKLFISNPLPNPTLSPSPSPSLSFPSRCAHDLEAYLSSYKHSLGSACGIKLFLPRNRSRAP
jgi:hypothetical protein